MAGAGEGHDMPQKLTVICNDDTTFEIGPSIYREISLFLDALQLSDASEESIPLPDVSGKVFTHVLTFLKIFENEEPYKKPTNFRDFERLPDEHPAMKFLTSLTSPEMGDLINAAAYLQAQRLIDYCLLVAINITHGRDTHEIRKELELRDDYTEEDEERFRARHTVDT